MFHHTELTPNKLRGREDVNDDEQHLGIVSDRQ